MYSNSTPHNITDISSQMLTFGFNKQPPKSSTVVKQINIISANSVFESIETNSLTSANQPTQSEGIFSIHMLYVLALPLLGTGLYSTTVTYFERKR